jgi:hypothetical protein
VVFAVPLESASPREEQASFLHTERSAPSSAAREMARRAVTVVPVVHPLKSHAVARVQLVESATAPALRSTVAIQARDAACQGIPGIMHVTARRVSTPSRARWSLVRPDAEDR